MDTLKKIKKTRVYYKYIDNDIVDDLHVIAVGHEKCRHDKKQEGPMLKNRFIIHYCVKGKGYYTLDGVTYTIKQGDIFYIPPNHVISYYPNKTDPWEYFWFEYNGQNAKKLSARALFDTKKPVYSPISPMNVEETLSSMISSLNDNTDDLIAVSHIYQFFSLVISERTPKKNSTRNVKDEQLKKIFDYINANYVNADMCLTDIAQHINMNASYLSRFFKENAGIPLSKYIIELRMQKAANLLKRKDLSVKSIAISVGYTDPLYFTREFRRHYKNTPTSYRKELFDGETKIKTKQKE